MRRVDGGHGTNHGAGTTGYRMTGHGTTGMGRIGTGPVAAVMAVALAVAGLTGLTGCAEQDANVVQADTRCVGRQSDARYDWPWYDSLDELEKASDVIVVATITGCTAPEREDAGYDTWINAKVRSGISGGGVERAESDRMQPPAAGEVILFNGYTSEASGAGTLEVGKSYVFFLGANGTDGDGRATGDADGVEYHEMTPALSVFPVTAKTNKDPASSRNEAGAFGLTEEMAVRLGIIGAGEPNDTEQPQG